MKFKELKKKNNYKIKYCNNNNNHSMKNTKKTNKKKMMFNIISKKVKVNR